MVDFKIISKHFGNNKALDEVSFNIKQGEIHALLGENGAGKSTLLNILHGVYSEYGGDVLLDGKKVSFKNATDAISAGISKVHQEVSVITTLTVGQNIALGYETINGGLIDYKKMYEKTDAILEKLGCNFKSSDTLNSLSVGELQMILIAKALFHNAKVISFDEPTSALADKEVRKLLTIIKELKASGITILYVTHRLDEVFEIADRASILRDGQYVTTKNIKDITKKDLIRNMVGRDVSSYATRVLDVIPQDEVVLEVDNLSVQGVYQDVSFKLHKGEILSFAGLVGAKRTDVMLTLFGHIKKTSGTIKLNSKEIDINSPMKALKYNFALIPENRKTQGFIQNFTNTQNIMLSSMNKFTNLKFFVDKKKARDNAFSYIEKVKLHPADPEYRTDGLSGGNAQKVIIAKWLTTDADIIIFDEPTKGIDVGAKAEIYQLMEKMLMLGKSIIMVSSELTEVIGMSDRVVIMREGRLVKELSKDEICEETILQYAMEG